MALSCAFVAALRTTHAKAKTGKGLVFVGNLRESSVHPKRRHILFSALILLLFLRGSMARDVLKKIA
jgi:hypothetical protein